MKWSKLPQFIVDQEGKPLNKLKNELIIQSRGIQMTITHIGRESRNFDYSDCCVFLDFFFATITFCHVIILTSFCLYIQLGVSYLCVTRTLNWTQWAHLKEETPPDAILLLLLPFISSWTHSSTHQSQGRVHGTRHTLKQTQHGFLFRDFCCLSLYLRRCVLRSRRSHSGLCWREQQLSGVESHRQNCINRGKRFLICVLFGIMIIQNTPKNTTLEITHDKASGMVLYVSKAV